MTKAIRYLEKVHFSEIVNDDGGHLAFYKFTEHTIEGDYMEMTIREREWVGPIEYAIEMQKQTIRWWLQSIIGALC